METSKKTTGLSACLFGSLNERRIKIVTTHIVLNIMNQGSNQRLSEAISATTCFPCPSKTPSQMPQKAAAHVPVVVGGW
jgi:hypothetical protein